MLYLLGGAARAGKSTVSRKFLAKTGIPFFALDYLMMGMAKGLPEYGVDPDGDDLLTGDKLWPIVGQMATAMLENGFEYLLEGVQLQPLHAHDLGVRNEGAVRACFLGFARADTRAKFHELRTHPAVHNDWLRNYSDAEVMETIEHLKSRSGQIERECIELGLPYFDVSSNFEVVTEEAVSYLTSS